MDAATLLIRDAGTERRVTAPVRLGGDSPFDVALPEPVAAGLALDQLAGQWWLRVGDSDTTRVNGRLQGVDCQLVDGDVIEVGGAHLVLRLAVALPAIDVYPLRGNETVAPDATPELPGEEVVAGLREIRVASGDDSPRNATTPLHATGAKTRGRVGLVLALLGAMLLVGAWWWIVPVPFALTPVDATLAASNGPALRLGDRLYLPRGERELQLQSPGYQTSRRRLTVEPALSSQSPQVWSLTPLPGVLQVETQGVASEVLVDGERVGSAPGAVTVAAGRRSLRVQAPRHLDFVTELEVTGRGQTQKLVATLAPAWGWLELDTRPAGARIFIDEKDLGPAPQRLELDAGLRMLEVRAAGRRPWRSQIAITPGQTLALGTIDLATPPPPMPIVAATTGASGGSTGAGADAVAAPTTVTPPAARLRSPLVGTLILVPAGSFSQGSERREQGRRSNESLRTVTITRPFHLAEREITNGQFRAFRAEHASGIAADRTLDLDGFAVSSVSWDDAVAFCNWLSQREGLPLAYERREGRWQRIEPFNTGYRLPTEAEWEYAARYVDGQRWRRFSWGASLPLPAAAENIAGEEIPANPATGDRSLPILPGHRDEHIVVAPVGTYGRSALGFADLGGNVSEWMHDGYVSLLPAAPVSDPQGDATSTTHVIRGASWQTASVAELRLAWRERGSAAAQTLGFRVARSTEGAP